MSALRIFWVLLVLLCGTAAAQNVHDVTWVAKAVAPGRVVTIGGQQFVLVRLPMTEFTNGNRYIVEYLAPVIDIGPPVAFFSQVSTVHTNETIPNPVTISGFPASILVQDSRSFNYNSNIGFDDGLSVEANVFGSVSIQTGDTLLTLAAVFSTTQQALTAVTTEFSASPWATWNYADPTALVTHFDNWLDYVRVLKIN